MDSPLLFGLDTFGDVTVDSDGSRLSQAQVIRNVIDEAVLAEAVGVDVFSVGEHHRPDFAISAPEPVLAAIASRTQQIRLGTAVTVLSSDEPVRVFERFATLDAIANGRAEITLGRGSFTESFPLFGYDLGDYERLFSEKLELMSHLLTEGAVTWEGSVRPALTNQQVYPKTERGRIPAWIGVGGSPESVVRAAQYGFPLTLAIIGGDSARFAQFVDLYHRALEHFEQERQPVAVHSPGFIAASDEEAREVLWPHYRDVITRIGRERGWPPLSRDRYDAEIDRGALYVGSPETVARKIARTVSVLKVDRFDLKYSNGTLPHERMMRAIELYGREVIPMVRELVAEESGIAV